jgi:hypothetical protein
MSSNSVTPDPSTLGSIVSGQPTPPNYVDQSSQNPAPPQVAPQSIGIQRSRLNTVLNAVSNANNPQIALSDQPPPAQPVSDMGGQDTPSGSPPSWKSKLGAVASVVSTGLSGIPDKGRPGFIQGLGSGARAEQKAQATEQAIKFQSFQDSVRAAQLNNEDIRMQWATDDHQTAVQDQADAEAKRMTAQTGMTYTKVPNTASDVTTHMIADAAQNGGASSVSPGTIMGPHALYVPNKGSADQAQALTKDYNMRAPAYGLPSVQPGQVVQPGAYDQLRQAASGMDNKGDPQSAAALANRIAILKDQLNANPSSEATSAIQSDIAHLTDLQTHHAARDRAGIAQATSDAVDKASKLGAIKTSNTEQVDDNKAGNKTQKTDAQMYVGSDASGNQVAGTSDDLKAAGVQGFTKMGASAGEKVTQAREMISPDGLFSAVAKDVADLQAKGKLGVAASRWSEFMGGTVGTDPDFAPLRTDMGLLSTKLMQVHVGARGSAEMLHHFANLADYKISDAPTLTAALKAEYRYIHGAAMLPKKTGGQ